MSSVVIVDENDLQTTEDYGVWTRTTPLQFSQRFKNHELIYKSDVVIYVDTRDGLSIEIIKNRRYDYELAREIHLIRERYLYQSEVYEFAGVQPKKTFKEYVYTEIYEAIFMWEFREMCEEQNRKEQYKKFNIDSIK